MGGGQPMVAVKIDRCVVDDALSDALGRQVTSQIDFQPSLSTTTGAAASWLNMLLMLTEQLFRPNSVLTRPLVGLPFVDSLVRGLLLAADHPHRDVVAAEPETGCSPHRPRRDRHHRGRAVCAVDSVRACGSQPRQRPQSPGGLPALSGHFADGVCA